MTARDRTPEPPYCWQSKEARRAIRERMNGHESTSATLSLYDALTEIASNEGIESFKAGQPYIGEIAGLSARTVRRLEPILEEIGAVGIFRPPLRGHHTYTLLSLGQGGPTLGQHCNQASCPPVEEHQKNREKHKKEILIESGFSTFWESYPRKVSKPSALKAWKRATLPPLTDILAALDKHKASDQWQDPRFIPHPATWINGCRWGDEVTMTTASQKLRHSPTKQKSVSTRFKFPHEN